MNPFGNHQTFACAANGLVLPTPPSITGAFERPMWRILHRLSHFPGHDIDEYRAKFGKADGEREFFDRFQPARTKEVRGNLLMYGGASLFIECL
ncbi:MAG: hypothetical protein KGL39_52565, partial [Patescibacteria group bacterium]|nr:hypothetical protein [Patescibacteria group bacterium]